MRTVHVRVHCPDRNSELRPGDEQRNELIIEDIVSTALLQTFDTVLVDYVTINCSPEDDDGDEDC
ncbi:MAG TPA: hypothetical protein VKV20_08070 [Ktedonobacteraceae bacterium]|jgi:hypothetical protein|nr:hypothetical protein [Ktedonobacteraceae bacterium]